MLLYFIADVNYMDFLNKPRLLDTPLIIRLDFLHSMSKSNPYPIQATQVQKLTDVSDIKTLFVHLLNRSQGSCYVS